MDLCAPSGSSPDLTPVGVKRSRWVRSGTRALAIAPTQAIPSLLVVAFLAVPAFCAAAEGAVKSLMERRTESVVLQAWDISCGAAALATVLRYQHGEQLTEYDIALRMMGRSEYIERPELVRLREGFSLMDMKRVADGLGYESKGFGKLTLGDLEKRAPIIVPVDINGYRHFVVFIGRLGNRVLLADPAYGRRTLRLPAFEQSWIEYPELGRVGLTVARRDGLFPPNRLLPRAEDFGILN